MTTPLEPKPAPVEPRPVGSLPPAAEPATSRTNKEPAFKRGITAAALMTKEFAPLRVAVPGLLVEGVTLFGGRPKIGKSWMAYDIALAVAGGLPVFGVIPVEEGDVLYLALEDSQRRLKARLRKKGIQQPPERLTLMTEWPRLNDGGIAEMEQWADAMQEPALVIVDVFAKLRPPKGKNESPYDADYLPMSRLGEFARGRGIAVLVVHHVRKSEADDRLESLSGTNGLTGAADSVMVLYQDSRTGQFRLYVRGRDIEESEMVVRFEREHGTWALLGEVGEIGRTTERQAILAVLRESDKPLNANVISDALNKNYDAIRKTLSRMAKTGEIAKVGRGLYTCPNVPNG